MPNAQIMKSKAKLRANPLLPSLLLPMANNPQLLLLPMADNHLLADISWGDFVETAMLAAYTMRDPKPLTVLLPMEPVLMTGFADFIGWAVADTAIPVASSTHSCQRLKRTKKTKMKASWMRWRLAPFCGTRNTLKGLLKRRCRRIWSRDFAIVGLTMKRLFFSSSAHTAQQ